MTALQHTYPQTLACSTNCTCTYVNWQQPAHGFCCSGSGRGRALLHTGHSHMHAHLCGWCFETDILLAGHMHYRMGVGEFHEGCGQLHLACSLLPATNAGWLVLAQCCAKCVWPAQQPHAFTRKEIPVCVCVSQCMRVCVCLWHVLPMAPANDPCVAFSVAPAIDSQSQGVGSAALLVNTLGLSAPAALFQVMCRCSLLSVLLVV